MAKNINKMSEKIRHFGAEEENKPAKPNHSALVECTLSLDRDLVSSLSSASVQLWNLWISCLTFLGLNFSIWPSSRGKTR